MNYLIALSGGLDSSVLLDIFHKQCAPHSLRAIHVHHGLNIAADQWALHCQAQCDQLGISLIIVQVSITPTPGESLEALARNARYAALAEHLTADEVLVTAHHQDDQAETFLLHALRGAGPKGLAAMPVLKKFGQSYHYRPLLSFNRQALADYAAQHNLVWVHDDSNDNIAFDRNFLRHQIIPCLKERWPKAIENLTRVSELQAELSDFLDELIIPYWAVIELEINKLTIHPDYLNNALFPLVVLTSLAPTLKNWLLRAWVKKVSNTILSKKQLQLIFREVIQAETDKQPQLKIGDFILRRFAGALWLTPALISQNLLDKKIQDCIHSVSMQKKLPADLFTVRFRETGESLLLNTQPHKTTLKKLFHNLRIPPWERPYTPLIYFDQQLISVGTHIISP